MMRERSNREWLAKKCDDEENKSVNVDKNCACCEKNLDSMR